MTGHNHQFMAKREDILIFNPRPRSPRRKKNPDDKIIKKLMALQAAFQFETHKLSKISISHKSSIERNLKEIEMILSNYDVFLG